jgi:hypothetical protein
MHGFGVIDPVGAAMLRGVEVALANLQSLSESQKEAHPRMRRFIGSTKKFAIINGCVCFVLGAYPYAIRYFAYIVRTSVACRNHPLLCNPGLRSSQ